MGTLKAAEHSLCERLGHSSSVLDSPQLCASLPRQLACVVVATGFACSSSGAPADADRDGLPDSWETAHYLDLSDPHDALLDKDADGRNNLEEYLTGRDPLTPYEYEVHHQDDAPATDAASLPDVGLPESVLLYDVDFGTPPHTVGEPVVIDPGPVPRTCPSGRRFIPAIVVEQLGLLYDQPASLRASQLIFHAEPSYEYPGISPSYPRYIVSMDLLIEQPGAGPMDYLKVFLDSPRIRTVRFSMDGAISKSQPAGSSAFLGRWEPGIPVRLRIDADLRAQS